MCHLLSLIKKTLIQLGAEIIPYHCILCRRQSHRLRDLCMQCEQELVTDAHVCFRCGLRLPEGNDICGACLQEPPYFDRLIAPWRYDYPLDQILNGLKHNGQLAYARVLSECFSEFIVNAYPYTKLPDAVIPIPLHRNRLRTRGFNQSKELLKSIKIKKLYSHCERIIDTPAQVQLTSRARKRNLRAAFKRVKAIECHHIAIFDDIVTTGTTVNELARLLKKSGVQQVDVWCVARTQLK